MEPEWRMRHSESVAFLGCWEAPGYMCRNAAFLGSRTVKSCCNECGFDPRRSWLQIARSRCRGAFARGSIGTCRTSCWGSYPGVWHAEEAAGVWGQPDNFRSNYVWVCGRDSRSSGSQSCRVLWRLCGGVGRGEADCRWESWLTRCEEGAELHACRRRKHHTGELVEWSCFKKAENYWDSLSRFGSIPPDPSNKLWGHRAGEVWWQKACKGPIDQEFRHSGCWRRIRINSPIPFMDRHRFQLPWWSLWVCGGAGNHQSHRGNEAFPSRLRDAIVYPVVARRHWPAVDAAWRQVCERCRSDEGRCWGTSVLDYRAAWLGARWWKWRAFILVAVSRTCDVANWIQEESSVVQEDPGSWRTNGLSLCAAMERLSIPVFKWGSRSSRKHVQSEFDDVQ